MVKHARAQHAELVLDQNEQQITLSICDDGQGFEKEQVEGGIWGLQIMLERAKNIGADLTIQAILGRVRKLASSGPVLEVKSRIW